MKNKLSEVKITQNLVALKTHSTYINRDLLSAINKTNDTVNPNQGTKYRIVVLTAINHSNGNRLASPWCRGATVLRAERYETNNGELCVAHT